MLQSLTLVSQNKVAPDTTSHWIKTKVSAYDGTFIIGYVDNGGFLNFTGPNINFSIKRHRIILGMLPSLRFKEDKSTVKNSFVMPALGFGITYSFKKFAIQLPVYYTNKTTVDNGHWSIGFGIGMRLK